MTDPIIRIRFLGRKFLGGSKNQPSEGWIDVDNFAFSGNEPPVGGTKWKMIMTFSIAGWEVTHRLIDLKGEENLGTAEFDLWTKKVRYRYTMTNVSITNYQQIVDYTFSHPRDAGDIYEFVMAFEKMESRLV